MRKLATAIILATSGIIATSAMAAPHDNHDRSPQKVVHQDKKQNWRPGQAVPKQYNSARYKVDHRDHKRLHKPGPGQHWIKANGHYVLINDHNHKIIKVVN